jgi:TrmH RNA methyltransferase
VQTKLADELAVCGLNAVKALADIHPEKINRLFLREDRFYGFTAACKILAERKRPYKICADEELERICKSSQHQGAVAMIYPPAPEELQETDLETWAAEGKTVLFLCDLSSDRDLGAIVRSAAFFDVPWVVLSNPELVSAGAYRAAEGGMEHVSFRTVKSGVSFLRKASKIMLSIGTDVRARLRIGDIPQLVRDASRRTGKKGIVLTLGNEETGLPPLVKSLCALLVRIPGTGAVESLSLSQEAALFLRAIYER